MDVVAVGGLEELEEVLEIEADGERVAVVGGLDGVLGLAGFGEEEETRSSFFSKRILMAAERSSANWATRWMAAAGRQCGR